MNARPIIIATFAALALTTTASAQLSIPWFTIDGGGGTSSGGAFTLSGTIGHTDAGTPMTGGAFTLTGGFWAGVATPPQCIADFNGDGSLDPDDLGDYINCYFALPPCAQADFNHDTNIDPDDLGDYINAYFAAAEPPSALRSLRLSRRCAWPTLSSSVRILTIKNWAWAAPSLSWPARATASRSLTSRAASPHPSAIPRRAPARPPPLLSLCLPPPPTKLRFPEQWGSLNPQRASNSISPTAESNTPSKPATKSPGSSRALQAQVMFVPYFEGRPPRPPRRHAHRRRRPLRCQAHQGGHACAPRL